ncbi:hypothetical protein SteCoe_17232 [Stentor coeruleus]|uniref:Guanylate cyclase domain-containing protein n=1 Tax=Stentor coeruleus TaxID=5963 RepID=A0A1R2BZR2_9CILI|nr:hypothetical protein SteCoe_17232 [Stentor coeruleus]
MSKKYVLRGNKMSSTERTRLKIFPEVIRNDDGVSVSGTVNRIAIIQTDKENEGLLNNCRKLSDTSHNEKFLAFLDSKKMTVTISLVTIYALFADDIKTLIFAKSADNIFSTLVVICLLLFSGELVLSSFFKPNYKWSFYFWLDLIATLSLITDIGWMWDNFIGVSNTSSSNKQLQNAGKASRAGTRTSRILRIIRLIRLIRLVKLYKNAQIAIKNTGDEEEQEQLKEELQNLGQESQVGKKLSEVTMKRVILIVLIMLFLLPMFEYDFYASSQTSWEYGVDELQKFLNNDGFEIVKNQYIEYHKNDLRPLVYLSWTNATGDYEWNGDINYNDLRYNEIFYYSYKNIISIFDLRYDSKLISFLNIFKTLFICVVLTLGALFFTKDAEELVIKPIETMLAKVRRIAKNPLSAMEIKTTPHINQLPNKKKRCLFCNKKPIKPSDYETMIIENTIIKIGILLALGFGEAGSAIIGLNVEKNNDIDSIMSGTKVVGIFGFCDIRNFTDTTEELQEGVMKFVNEIAQIVHGLTSKYFGAANKNIGDAFLIVWKFSPEEVYVEDEIIVRNPSSKKAFYVPDLALLSFMKILAKVHKDPNVLKYRSYQKLVQRMPNYEVKMGFGMHMGWAIEGAIGSQFKVDASYLSPHVNLASALEASTKMYGVPILISGALYDILSNDIQNYCRKIDVVILKGMSKQLNLYTCDCDFKHFIPGKLTSRKKEVYSKKCKNLKKKLEKGEISTKQIFSKSDEFSLMREGFTYNFYNNFRTGFKFYIAGEWMQAKPYIEKSLEIRPKDGPSLSLINFIGEFAFRCPSSWRNYRVIG